jgi:hypothetical protein
MGIGMEDEVNHCQLIVSVEEVGSNWQVIPGWMVEEVETNCRKTGEQELKDGKLE